MRLLLGLELIALPRPVCVVRDFLSVNFLLQNIMEHFRMFRVGKYEIR